MIPGIVALLLLVVTTNLSAMAIVREKEVGTLEQLNVTPLARWELIVGKLLPYALIGMIDVVLVLVVAIYWFEVPMRGSIPLLFGMSLIYLLTHARPGPVRLDDLAHAAAGDDDDDVLLPDADDLPVGIHLPDREHAGVDPAGDLPDSAALLPGDRARHLPEGRRPRDAVAAGAGAVRVGRRGADAGDAAIVEAARDNDHEIRTITMIERSAKLVISMILRDRSRTLELRSPACLFVDQAQHPGAGDEEAEDREDRRWLDAGERHAEREDAAGRARWRSARRRQRSQRTPTCDRPAPCARTARG